jgi:hypothetical protein
LKQSRELAALAIEEESNLDDESLDELGFVGLDGVPDQPPITVETRKRKISFATEAVLIEYNPAQHATEVQTRV